MFRKKKKILKIIFSDFFQIFEVFWVVRELFRSTPRYFVILSQYIGIYYLYSISITRSFDPSIFLLKSIENFKNTAILLFSFLFLLRLRKKNASSPSSSLCDLKYIQLCCIHVVLFTHSFI